MKKNRDLLIYFLVLILSIFIVNQWNAEIFGEKNFLKNKISLLLDPTLGAILRWNLYLGFLINTAIISFVIILAQKYLSNQAELKELRKEQKILQEEIKKYKDNPEKLMELNKKQLEFIPKTFNLTMKPLMYTSIPIILLFRWFGEYFSPIFGWWWILYYIIGSVIFSSIFRKLMDVV